MAGALHQVAWPSESVYKLSALKGGGVLDELETRSKAYKHGQDRMMVHSIVLPH